MRVTTFILGIPVALAAIWIAVANRAPVTFSLDPFSPDAPALAVQMPLYLLVFMCVLIGVILAGLAVGFRRLARGGARIADAAQARATALLPQRLRKTKNAPP